MEFASRKRDHRNNSQSADALENLPHCVNPLVCVFAQDRSGIRG